MNRNRIVVLLALSMAISLNGFAQKLDKTAADSLYDYLIHSPSVDPQTKLKLAKDLEVFSRSTKDSCRLAQLNGMKTNYYDVLGHLDSSIASGQLALEYYKPGCDSLILMFINVNLTGTYLSLGENDRVIEMVDRNLALWNDKWTNTKSKNSFYTNKAIAQVYKGDFEVAMTTFKELRTNAHKEGNWVGEMDAYNNISALFGMFYSRNQEIKSYLDSAEFYVKESLHIGKRLGRTEETIIHFMNLSSIAKDKNRNNLSLLYIDSAMALANQGKYLDYRSTLALSQSRAFEGIGDLKKALTSLKYHITLKDSLLDTEKVKAISEMQEKYESEKKERQIRELEVNNLNAVLREEQLTRTRNIYLFTGLGILLLAAGLWRRLLYTRKAKASIQREKDISEGLLLNILPEEIAQELKEKGKADARNFDLVSILFTDFKGFTEQSAKLSASELVYEINQCFEAFDGIIEKYNIEKIKTIGDAYMAAGGLPVPTDESVKNTVLAALEMQAFISKRKTEMDAVGKLAFEMRVGIHTGPVVAGIVGVKKFQYDIWGDTVNTASRIESNGEVGKVNISQATYELLKSDPDFAFESRGKIEAKGKGEMEMLFVSVKSEE